MAHHLHKDKTDCEELDHDDGYYELEMLAGFHPEKAAPITPREPKNWSCLLKDIVELNFNS